MMDKIIYDGFKFHLNKKSGYYYNSNIRMYLHRYKYSKEVGAIPEGYEIHHIDTDKSNNDLSNLQCISKKEHKDIHTGLIDDEYRDKMRVILAEKAQPKSKEWHSSEEGIEWHKQHYENIKEKMFKKKMFVCKVCGNEYVGYDLTRNMYCGVNCKAKSQRDNSPKLKKDCVVCASEFETTKIKNKKTCSRSCSGKLSRISKDSPNLRE